MSAARNQRPGGVTALAIISFIEFAFGLMTLMSIAFVLIKLKGGDSEEFGKTSDVLMVGAFDAALTGLLLLCGIGLIGCRRFLGRHLTTLVFLVSTAKAVTVINIVPDQFSLMTVAFVAWPFIATVLVNTVFKDDLIR